MKTIGLYFLLVASRVEGYCPPNTAARADIFALESAVEMYRVNYGLPSTQDGLRSLVERPSALGSDVRWHPLMHKLPNDPWGHPYCYIVGEGFSSGFGVYSLGADGQSTTQGNDADDINSWRGYPPKTQYRFPLWVLSFFTATIGFLLGRLSATKPLTTESGPRD